MAEPEDAARADLPTADQNLPGAVKDPDDWKTGDEPATDSQKSYLGTLAQEAHETIDVSSMTKAEAATEIDRLQEKTGRHGGQQQQSAGS